MKSLVSDMESKKAHYERRIGELTGAQNDSNTQIKSLQVSTVGVPQHTLPECCTVCYCILALIEMYSSLGYSSSVLMKCAILLNYCPLIIHVHVPMTYVGCCCCTACFP